MNHQTSTTPKRPTSRQSVAAADDIPDLMDDEKQVRFTAHVQINIFDRIIDPALKADLYYSREEMYCIRQEVRGAIILHRQRIKLKELQAKFNKRKACIDSLVRSNETKNNERKRLLEYENQRSTEESVLDAKRRRIQ